MKVPESLEKKHQKAMARTFFGKFSYDFSINEQQFIVAGDWAFERAKFTSIMTPNSGGEPMTHSGTFTVLWYRDRDKDWYIERYIDDTNL